MRRVAVCVLAGLFVVPRASGAQPAVQPPTPPEPPAQRVAVEVNAGVGLWLFLPMTGRIAIGIDAAVAPWLSVNAAAATAGGDGWSGPQYSAMSRLHQPLVVGARSWGAALGIAVGDHGYRQPISSHAGGKRWDRAYISRVQVSTESTGRVRTRWFLELGFVLNPGSYRCNPDEDCSDDGGNVIFGGGLALGFGVL